MLHSSTTVGVSVVRTLKMYSCYQLVCLLMISATTWRSLNATTSGFYGDNGRNQTIIERRLTPNEIDEIKLNFLQFFGIKHVPRRPRDKKALKNSNSQFLIDIYKKFLRDVNTRIIRDVDTFGLNKDEENAIDQSDTILALANNNDMVAGVRHERGQRLWFNTSDVPQASNILGAELRIFKNAIDSNTTYVLNVYKLINIDNGERDLEFIESVNITGDYSGWLDINMTIPLTKWVAFQETNKGLYLAMYQADKPGHEIKLEDAGLVTASVHDDNQPFTVAFVKTKIDFKMKLRTKRQAPVELTTYDPKDILKHPYESEEEHEAVTTCRLRSFYISFKDLNWQDWIIAPDGYNAFYCSGECNFPLNAYMNATNHAIIQTLAHLVHPDVFPKACCVPTKYLPISVLYFLEDSNVSNVALKRYKKMIAKSCGCH